MPPRPRRFRMRAFPTVRPIILSWVEQDVRVMERGPVEGAGEGWTPEGGVAEAVAEPGLEGAPSVDIPSLSSSGPAARGSPTRWTFYNIHFMEWGEKSSKKSEGVGSNSSC